MLFIHWILDGFALHNAFKSILNPKLLFLKFLIPKKLANFVEFRIYIK
jgi:hypothetical protein